MSRKDSGAGGGGLEAMTKAVIRVWMPEGKKEREEEE